VANRILALHQLVKVDYRINLGSLLLEKCNRGAAGRPGEKQLHQIQ
jgi:hypothetical protein